MKKPFLDCMKKVKDVGFPEEFVFCSPSAVHRYNIAMVSLMIVVTYFLIIFRQLKTAEIKALAIFATFLTSPRDSVTWQGIG